MKVIAIAAMAENRVIGNKGRLPWRQKRDLEFFRNTTMGHCTIMGRKTFESIPVKLPGRTCIVISRQKDLKLEGAVVVHSIEEALTYSKGQETVFITGGAEIYKLALPKTDKILLTVVHAKPEGDAFFPELDEKVWQMTACEKHKKDEENQYDYDFCTYERL